MKKLKTYPERLRSNHPEFPIDLIIKINGIPVACKFCGRTPLVEGFDYTREEQGKQVACCFECMRDGRAFKGDAQASLMALGEVMSGIRNYTFPHAPSKGTTHREEAGICVVCRKPVYYNPYKKKLIGAFHEILRDAYVHNRCNKKWLENGCRPTAEENKEKKDD
jgi:hypothetical protein